MQVPQHYVRRRPLGPFKQLRIEPLAWPVFRLANVTEQGCGGWCWLRATSRRRKVAGEATGWGATATDQKR